MAGLVTLRECSRSWGPRGCSNVEAKQVPAVISVPWIHFTSSPPTHACLCHPHPPPWLSLSSDLSLPQTQVIPKSPDSSESPRGGALAEKSQNSACFILQKASEQESCWALDLCDAQSHGHRSTRFLFMSAETCKPWRENTNSSCLGVYAFHKSLPRAAVCFLNGDYISYFFDYLL